MVKRYSHLSCLPFLVLHRGGTVHFHPPFHPSRLRLTRSEACACTQPSADGDDDTMTAADARRDERDGMGSPAFRRGVFHMIPWIPLEALKTSNDHYDSI